MSDDAQYGTKLLQIINDNYRKIYVDDLRSVLRAFDQFAATITVLDTDIDDPADIVSPSNGDAYYSGADAVAPFEAFSINVWRTGMKEGTTNTPLAAQWESYPVREGWVIYSVVAGVHYKILDDLTLGEFPNPFNQSLNTTNNVTFNSITLATPYQPEVDDDTIKINANGQLYAALFLNADGALTSVGDEEGFYFISGVWVYYNAGYKRFGSDTALTWTNKSKNVPIVSGTFEAGNTISATTGDWGSPTPTGFHYQWGYWDSPTFTPIEGANSSTYDLTEDDVGNSIMVKVYCNDNNSANFWITDDANYVHSSAAHAVT